MTAPLLSVRGLSKRFPPRRRAFWRREPDFVAVDDVSFDIGVNETLGLVGESGCGKSTTARLIMRLLTPSAGEVQLEGRSLTAARGEALRQMRRHVQMVFQDPFASLNPRMKVSECVAEPLRYFRVASGPALRARIAELFDQVGLAAAMMDRHPAELSGGQRQRVGIARALALKPKLIVCDEAVSALDVSVQAQVLNLLSDLQRDLGLSYLFVAHDIAVVEFLSHRVAVMYLGRIVEIGAARDVLERPVHPYTQALIAAIPREHPSAPRARDETLAVSKSTTQGCKFRPRCPIAEPRCATAEPPLRRLADGRSAACFMRADSDANAAELATVAADP